MEKKWKTKSGREIPFNELKDDHLVNILTWSRKKAREGIQVIFPAEFPHFPRYAKLKGKKALDKLNYWDLKEIAKQRKLI